MGEQQRIAVKQGGLKTVRRKLAMSRKREAAEEASGSDSEDDFGPAPVLAVSTGAGVGLGQVGDEGGSSHGAARPVHKKLRKLDFEEVRMH